MINKQMKELIEKRKALHPQDDEGAKHYWELELEVLSVSLDYTIDYLNTAPEEEIYWCSEVWTELSKHWQSKELIDAMEGCQKRFPKIANDLQLDIECAKSELR